MRTSWKLGRVSGIDVFLHPTFLLVLLFPQVGAWGLFGLALVLAGFGCVLLHELGHALMARRFGIATRDITLYPIGGVARLERMPRAPGAELLIALAGPAVNLVIAAGLAGLGFLGRFPEVSGESLGGTFFVNLLAVNLMLALFNLLPAFPMDGGRVLRALLSGWLGRVRATRIAAGIGRTLAVVGGTLCVLYGHPFQALLAAFLYVAAGAELAGVVAEDEGGRPGDGGGGIWTAPPGYRWVPRGRGAWQLAPITIRVDDGGRRGWN